VGSGLPSSAGPSLLRRAPARFKKIGVDALRSHDDLRWDSLVMIAGKAFYRMSEFGRSIPYRRVQYTKGKRAGPGCLKSAPRNLSGFLPGYADCGASRFLMRRREGVARPELHPKIAREASCRRRDRRQGEVGPSSGVLASRLECGRRRFIESPDIVKRGAHFEAAA